MDLHLSNTDGTLIRLFVDGDFAGELSIGVFDGRDTLEARIAQARCLAVLAHLLPALGTAAATAADGPDHHEATPVKRQAAFCRGLGDGLAVRVGGHAPVRESSRSYERGYSHGANLRHVLDVYQDHGTPS